MTCPRYPSDIPVSEATALRMLRQIMAPKCIDCSDTGVICGPTFDTENPTTHEDWTYCLCERGLKYLREDDARTTQIEE